VGDDRVESPEEPAPRLAGVPHPVTDGLPERWPEILGYQRLAARDGCPVLAEVGDDRSSPSASSSRAARSRSRPTSARTGAAGVPRMGGIRAVLGSGGAVARGVGAALGGAAGDDRGVEEAVQRFPGRTERSLRAERGAARARARPGSDARRGGCRAGNLVAIRRFRPQNGR
jgi:hypothetical protein